MIMFNNFKKITLNETAVISIYIYLYDVLFYIVICNYVCIFKNKINFSMEYDDYETSEEQLISRYKNYYEFLGDFIKNEDKMYLEDEDLARDVKELYEINKGDIKNEEEFNKRKKELEQRGVVDENKEKPLYSQDKIFQQGSFLFELASREQEVRNGRKSTIIFIRYKDQNEREYSAYIDYRERLKTDNFEEIFNGTKDLIPRQSDLSFYSWNQKKIFSNDSTFFRVDAAPKERLSFRNNTDRKTINVDLEYLEQNQNLDVNRYSIELNKNEENIDALINQISSNERRHKDRIKTDITRKVKFQNISKIKIDNKKDYGYQQIVIFDYQTRNK